MRRPIWVVYGHDLGIVRKNPVVQQNPHLDDFHFRIVAYVWA